MQVEKSCHRAGLHMLLASANNVTLGKCRSPRAFPRSCYLTAAAAVNNVMNERRRYVVVHAFMYEWRCLVRLFVAKMCCARSLLFMLLSVTPHSRRSSQLVLALVASFMVSANAQLGGYTNSTYAKSVSMKLAKAALLTAFQAASPTCVLPVADDGSIGSIFARIKEGSPLLAAAKSLGVGSTLPLAASDLEGPVPWLLGSWFPNQANVTFNFVAVKLDYRTVPMHDRTAVALAAMAATNAACVADAITVDTNVSSLFRLSSPIAAFGYQVVTPRPTLPEETVLHQVWLWLQCVARFPTSTRHHAHAGYLRSLGRSPPGGTVAAPARSQYSCPSHRA